jgi:DNA-binding beta-propeller fold protein YncE
MLQSGKSPASADGPQSRRGFLYSSALTLGGVFLPRVLSTAEDEPAARPPRFLLAWGKKGKGRGEFHSPIGIAINRKDEVLVTDFHNGRVQTFSAEGKFLAAFPVSPFPGGIAVDRTGTFYVTHFPEFGDDPSRGRGTDKVSVHDASGKRVREWGRPGARPGEFSWPGGIALGPEGRVYVADQTNRRVQVFTPEGKFLFQWGRYGTGLGEFGGNTSPKARTGGPQFLAFDSRGHIYTTEASMGRVQEFTATGKFVHAWGDNSTKPGGFGGRPKNLPGPIALCIDRHDRVWVSATNHRVQQFTRAGAYLRGFGGRGDGPGQFITPHGLALDSRGHLYVVDSQNHRVQTFAV